MIQYVRSPTTLAEWKLCKPGDVIELLGYRVEITEANYHPFMNEIMWYVNWFIGGQIGDWILPNPNPSKLTRYQIAVDNLYVVSGIMKVLAKYERKEDRDPHRGFMHYWRTLFGGVPLVE